MTSASPFSNSVLAALPEMESARLALHLIPCLLHSGQVLYEKGDVMDTVYFPKSGILSLVLSSQVGVDVEVGIIGRDGVLGAMEALGHNRINTRVNVQIAGTGWRMSAEALRLECAQGGALFGAVLLASYQLNQQASQSVLCNRLHSVEERLARWLLMCHDRTGSEFLELTHEFLSNMLGVRRVGVTLAAGALRDSRLIDYRRGSVAIIDRRGLEARACECYALLRLDESSPAPSEAEPQLHARNETR